MKDAYMRRQEIARGTSAIDMIHEFGSVKAAREWLEQQEFWLEMADRVDADAAEQQRQQQSEPLSHKQWRADQIDAGVPVPQRVVPRAAHVRKTADGRFVIVDGHHRVVE